MRHLNVTKLLSVVFLASTLGACAAQVEIETREDATAGALEQSQNNPGCLVGTIQHTTCTDPSDLKLEAYNQCLQANMVLTGFQYEPVCQNWQTDLAHYECCAAPPAPPPPPPLPPPTAPGPGCTFGFLGDGQTCQNLGEIKQSAYDACILAGKDLTNIFVQEQGTCAAGEGTSLGYECCEAPPPPPPPTEPGPGCTFGFLGDGQTCQNLGEIKLTAYDACILAGKDLTNIFVQEQGACSDGSGTSLGYECCEAPPPPPPPVVCLAGTLGDGQTCLDLGNIKFDAHTACEQAGLMLFDLQIVDVGSCSPHEGLLVDYKCTAPNNVCP